MLLGQRWINVSPLRIKDFDLGPTRLPSFIELVAKTFNRVIETSFDEFLDLFLKIFVLIGSVKPRFSHDDDEEMASGEEGKSRRKLKILRENSVRQLNRISAMFYTSNFFNSSDFKLTYLGLMSPERVVGL